MKHCYSRSQYVSVHILPVPRLRCERSERREPVVYYIYILLLFKKNALNLNHVMFSMLSLFLLSFSFLHREIYIGRLEAQPASSPTHSLFLCKILMVEKNSTTTSFFLFLSSTATIPDRGLLFHIYIMVPCHVVGKSQKKSHSTLRAKQLCSHFEWTKVN